MFLHTYSCFSLIILIVHFMFLHHNMLYYERQMKLFKFTLLGIGLKIYKTFSYIFMMFVFSKGYIISYLTQNDVPK